MNEEFLQHLVRGGELLSAGKVIEAKDYLERAHQIDPKNEKGQNLLGLTYFKLGLFDRAGEIYELLVRDNPVDPTLRVNLGLVHLKSGALEQAIHEFETAVDLAPEHKKSQNYLGLALAQAGQYARAREHFVLAGSESMVQKMDRVLTGEEQSPVVAAAAPPPAEPARSGVTAEGGLLPDPREQVTPPPAFQQVVQQIAPPPEVSAWVGLDSRASRKRTTMWGGSAEAPPPAVEAAASPAASPLAGETELRFAEDEGPTSEFTDPTTDVHVQAQSAVLAAVASVSEEVAPPPTESAGLDAEEVQESMVVELTPQEQEVAAPPPRETVVPVAAAKTVVSPAPEAAPQATSVLIAEPAPQLPMADFLPTLQVFADPGAQPFDVKAEVVAIRVRGEILTRLVALCGYRGTLDMVPEFKRFRGRVTDRPFGEGEAQVVRVQGRGLVVVERRKKEFVALDVGDESAYFREDLVFAFDEPLTFENGRVPSEGGADLELVHLRGKGNVLLCLPGPLRTLAVRMDQPAVVPLSHLVGWFGNLTPRMLTLGGSAAQKGARPAVSLSGEGFSLFTVAGG